MAYEEYVGKTEKRTDTVWPTAHPWPCGDARRTGAEVSPDGRLPPLWHWMLFQEWAPASGLGPDGHPKRGGFLPPVHDLPRRMWAGGRVEFMGDRCARRIPSGAPARSSKSRKNPAAPAGWCSSPCGMSSTARRAYASPRNTISSTGGRRCRGQAGRKGPAAAGRRVQPRPCGPTRSCCSATQP